MATTGASLLKQLNNQLRQNQAKVAAVVAALVVIGIAIFLAVSIYSDSKIKPRGIVLTNRTDTSVTVIWQTEDKSVGKIWFGKEDSWNAFLPSNGKDTAYEDRDLVLDNEGEYQRIDASNDDKSRYTHHVTLRNLEPNTEYFFRVAGKYLAKDTTNIGGSEFKTLDLREGLNTPDPGYGKVEGVDADDSVIIFAFAEESEDEAYLGSTTISENSTYSIDLNPFSLEGEDASAKNLRAIIKDGVSTTRSHFFETEQYKPFKTLVTVERDDDRDDSSSIFSDLVGEISAQDNTVNSLAECVVDAHGINNYPKPAGGRCRIGALAGTPQGCDNTAGSDASGNRECRNVDINGVQVAVCLDRDETVSSFTEVTCGDGSKLANNLIRPDTSTNATTSGSGDSSTTTGNNTGAFTCRNSDICERIFGQGYVCGQDSNILNNIAWCHDTNATGEITGKCLQVGNDVVGRDAGNYGCQQRCIINNAGLNPSFIAGEEVCGGGLQAVGNTPAAVATEETPADTDEEGDSAIDTCLPGVVGVTVDGDSVGNIQGQNPNIGVCSTADTFKAYCKYDYSNPSDRLVAASGSITEDNCPTEDDGNNQDVYSFLVNVLNDNSIALPAHTSRLCGQFVSIPMDDHYTAGKFPNYRGLDGDSDNYLGFRRIIRDGVGTQIRLMYSDSTSCQSALDANRTSIAVRNSNGSISLRRIDLRYSGSLVSGAVLAEITNRCTSLGTVIDSSVIKTAIIIDNFDMTVLNDSSYYGYEMIGDDVAWLYFENSDNDAKDCDSVSDALVSSTGATEQDVVRGWYNDLSGDDEIYFYIYDRYTGLVSGNATICLSAEKNSAHIFPINLWEYVPSGSYYELNGSEGITSRFFHNGTQCSDNIPNREVSGWYETLGENSDIYYHYLGDDESCSDDEKINIYDSNYNTWIFNFSENYYSATDADGQELRYFRESIPCTTNSLAHNGASGDSHITDQQPTLSNSLLQLASAQQQTRNSVSANETALYSFFQDGELIAQKEVIVPEGGDALELKLFHDNNANGVRDEGEEFFDDYSSIGISREASIQEYHLNAGWNLINLNLASQASDDPVYTASGLLEKWADDDGSQGANVIHIARFDQGEFKLFTRRESGNTYTDDFPLIPGEGYFVFNMGSSARVTITGNEYTDPVPISLDNGWNLVGVISPGVDYQSDTLLKAIEADGPRPSTISQYENGIYKSIIKEDELVFGNNFKIIDTRGYFVRIEEGGGVEFRP